MVWVNVPAVAGEVFDRALPLAVLVLGRFLQHPGPVLTGPRKLRVSVRHPHLEQVGHDAWLGGLLLAMDVRHPTVQAATLR